jgi:hypothetical protein
VARAKSQEGLVVVKVFAIHDPTLPLATYKTKLEDIRSKLALSVNCLPFQKITVRLIKRKITNKILHFFSNTAQREIRTDVQRVRQVQFI